MKQPQKIEQFKDFMFSNYSGYNLLSSSKTSLSFRKDIPAQTPSCGVVGCLLIFGIIPGIAYYFLTKKEARSYALNFSIRGQSYNITGNSPDIYKIKSHFGKYISSGK